MKSIIFLTLLLVIIPQIGRSFPQLIRHGYTSCTTCHASPRGGGVMTDYGRALSKEVLSTWGYEGEENWHYGALDKTKVVDWLHIGGDYRAIQAYSKDERATIGRFIQMQEQIEVAAFFKNTWLSLTAGADTLKKSHPWYIPGFYVSHQLTEKLQFRLGKFVPRFGINTPEHIFSTRGPLGFGFQGERDTIEANYIEEKWDFSISSSSGQLRSKQEARAFHSQFNYSFTTKDKVGLSFEKKMDDTHKTSLGLHALTGFSETIYLITDTVFSDSQVLNSKRTGSLYHFTQLGYEFTKGLHFFLLEDLKKIDITNSRSLQSMYGAGITFYPRPHFEFQIVFTKRKNPLISENSSDYGWLLMHYYL